jgi:hypothetical protein
MMGQAASPDDSAIGTIQRECLTAESKGEATPTYGSERGTAPASGGRPRSRHRPRELHRPLGLLLHDDRARGDKTALEHIANVKPHKVAPAQLAADGEIEPREFPGSMIQLQANPDGPGRLSPYIWLAMTASACASIVVSVFPLCALNWLI